MFVWFLLFSILSGILAGMGMGGGTLLIPILTMVMNVEQRLAQALNLLVFIPCSLVVCIIYTKNRLINYKKSWLISVVASLVSIVAVVLVLKIKSEILSIIFGIFLIVLGGVQLVVQIVNDKKNCPKYIPQKEI